MSGEQKGKKNESPMRTVNIFGDQIWPKMSAKKSVGKTAKEQPNAAQLDQNNKLREKETKILCKKKKPEHGD